MPSIDPMILAIETVRGVGAQCVTEPPTRGLARGRSSLRPTLELHQSLQPPVTQHNASYSKEVRSIRRHGQIPVDRPRLKLPAKP
jgi:hypothetical protein